MGSLTPELYLVRGYHAPRQPLPTSAGRGFLFSSKQEMTSEMSSPACYFLIPATSDEVQTWVSVHHSCNVRLRAFPDVAATWVRRAGVTSACVPCACERRVPHRPGPRPPPRSLASCAPWGQGRQARP